MSAIHLNLPAGAVAKGVLRSAYESPRHLHQDVLAVRLANGFHIDVGWFPEFDPKGAFQIVVYRNDIDDKVTPPVETSKPLEVARIVEELAREYSVPKSSRRAVQAPRPLTRLPKPAASD